MPEGNFDLVPPPDRIGSNWKRDTREAFDLRMQTVEELGYTFPMYRGMSQELVENDLAPFSADQNKKVPIEPMSAQDALKWHIQNGSSLVSLAWSHATHPIPLDPTLSWTTDIEVAREMARHAAERSGKGGVVIEVQGSPMPTAVATFEDLRPNFAIYIPILTKIKGGWPSEQSKAEKEAVTFGKFPKELYKVIEEVK